MTRKSYYKKRRIIKSVDLDSQKDWYERSVVLQETLYIPRVVLIAEYIIKKRGMKRKSYYKKWRMIRSVEGQEEWY